jgi:hypothetical protein
MAFIAEIIVTSLFILLSVLFTQELLNLGLISLEIFPFAPLFSVIIALTLVINKVTSYVVGINIENKEMKDKETLRALLKEELQPLKEEIAKVIDNQNKLILELLENGVIKKTTQIPTSF